MPWREREERFLFLRFTSLYVLLCAGALSPLPPSLSKHCFPLFCFSLFLFLFSCVCYSSLDVVGSVTAQRDVEGERSAKTLMVCLLVAVPLPRLLYCRCFHLPFSVLLSVRCVCATPLRGKSQKRSNNRTKTSPRQEIGHETSYRVFFLFLPFTPSSKHFYSLLLWLLSASLFT